MSNLLVTVIKAVPLKMVEGINFVIFRVPDISKMDFVTPFTKKDNCKTLNTKNWHFQDPWYKNSIFETSDTKKCMFDTPIYQRNGILLNITFYVWPTIQKMLLPLYTKMSKQNPPYKKGQKFVKIAFLRPQKQKNAFSISHNTKKLYFETPIACTIFYIILVRTMSGSSTFPRIHVAPYTVKRSLSPS